MRNRQGECGCGPVLVCSAASSKAVVLHSHGIPEGVTEARSQDGAAERRHLERPQPPAKCHKNSYQQCLLDIPSE